MLNKLIIVCMLLVVVSSFVLAEEVSPTGPQNNPIQEANKYLSAEATKQIKAMKEEVLAEVRANNDANFQQLDGRMIELMADVKMKVVLAALGVMLLGNGIGVFFLIRSFRNTSYEAYLEKQLDTIHAELAMERSEEAQAMKAGDWQARAQYSERDLQAFRDQQGNWQQPASQSFATQIGPVAASQQSMMNEWQTEPAYAGAWESPVKVQRGEEFVEIQQPYEEIPHPETVQQQEQPGSFPNPWGQ